VTHQLFGLLAQWKQGTNLLIFRGYRQIVSWNMMMRDFSDYNNLGLAQVIMLLWQCLVFTSII